MHDIFRLFRSEKCVSEVKNAFLSLHARQGDISLYFSVLNFMNCENVMLSTVEYRKKFYNLTHMHLFWFNIYAKHSQNETLANTVVQ